MTTTSTLRETTKAAKRFRVKIGDSYARLDRELHDKGVFVKCRDVHSADVFKTNAAAGTAIQRTMELKSRIRGSMYADWKKFDCVRYAEFPQVEEFQARVQNEE